MSRIVRNDNVSGSFCLFILNLSNLSRQNAGRFCSKAGRHAENAGKRQRQRQIRKSCGGRTVWAAWAKDPKCRQSVQQTVSWLCPVQVLGEESVWGRAARGRGTVSEVRIQRFPQRSPSSGPSSSRHQGSEVPLSPPAASLWAHCPAVHPC